MWSVAILVDSFSIARCLRFPVGLRPRMARRTIFEGKCVGQQQTRGAHTHTDRSLLERLLVQLYFTTCCVVWPQAHNANHMLDLFAVSIMDFARVCYCCLLCAPTVRGFFRLGAFVFCPAVCASTFSSLRLRADCFVRSGSWARPCLILIFVCVVQVVNV